MQLVIPKGEVEWYRKHTIGSRLCEYCLGVAPAYAYSVDEQKDPARRGPYFVPHLHLDRLCRGSSRLADPEAQA